MAGLLLLDADGNANVTATAGTRIQALLGGKGRMYTHLIAFSYLSQGTAHTITIMRGQSRARLSAAAAGGQAIIVVDTALTCNNLARNLAANDFMALKLPSGVWSLVKVSTVSTDGLTITLTANLATAGALKAADVVAYGVAADSTFATAQYPSTASTTVTFPTVDTISSLIRSTRPNEPLLFDSNNATAAGTLIYSQWGHARAG